MFFRLKILSATLIIAIIARSTEKTVKIIQMVVLKQLKVLQSHTVFFGILFVTAAAVHPQRGSCIYLTKTGDSD